MREILFRGKTSSGKWVYGNYAESNSSMVTGKKSHKAWIISDFASNGGWIVPLGRCPVDEKTVGQYTGLKDKNGNRIFEGDIVRIATNGTRNLETYSIDFAPEIGMYVIHNHRDMGDDRDFTMMHGYELEVIGNVHDNPELLKGESK